MTSLLPSLRNYRPVRCDDLMRVGSEYDGGYVLPRRAIEASHALLGLGIFDNWDFEAAVVGMRPGLRLLCVDGTTGVEAIRRRARREMLRAALRLRGGKFLRMARLFPRARAFGEFFSRHELLPLLVGGDDAPGHITLAALLDRVGAEGRCDVLVKMDIEGAEYASIASAGPRLQRITALAIEFHELGRRWPEFVATMALLERDFAVVHLHGNNNFGYVPGTRVPETLEVTLLNRSLMDASAEPSRHNYPVPGIDRPNRRRRPDMPLDFSDRDGRTSLRPGSSRARG